MDVNEGQLQREGPGMGVSMEAEDLTLLKTEPERRVIKKKRKKKEREKESATD